MESNRVKEQPAKGDFKQRFHYRIESMSPYLYIAPFYILYLLFNLFPLIFSVVLAVGRWDGIGDISFVGMANFQRLVADPNFWQSLWNTLIIWLVGTVPMLVFALIFAFLISLNFVKSKHLLRTIFFLPNVTSVVAVTLLFGIIFSNFDGLANGLLQFLGFESIGWLNSPTWTRIIIGSINVWLYMGYNMVIYLTGITRIPDELYEAAILDGASTWQMFRYVTIPQLKPIILFTVIMSTIGGLQVFTEAQVLVPKGATAAGGEVTIMYYMFQNAFVNNQYGYGTTIAWALSFLILVVSVVNWLLTSRIEGNN